MKYIDLIEELKQEKDKVINKQALSELYAKTYKNKHHRSFENVLSYLKRNNVITELEKDRYMLVTKEIYEYREDDKVKEIYELIKKEYPEIDLIVWNTAVINDFTLHYSINNYIVVEIERIAIEIVVALLKEMYFNKYTVVTQDMLNSNRDFYLNDEKFVVVKPLLIKAPLVRKNNKKYPTLEKIMVDLYRDKLYMQFQGRELRRIYENIFEKYDINMRKLIKYASERMDVEVYKEYINKLYIPSKYKLEG